MNDFLFFKLNDGSIRKLQLLNDALQEVVKLWVVSYKKFIDKNITPVKFNGSFKPDEDEVLYVEMTLPEEFKDIPNNKDNYEEINIPDDSIKTICLYHNGDFYFQNFLNNVILKPFNIPLIWSDDVYKKFNDKKAFIIEDIVHAIYHEGKLYFRSYSSARQLFDLSAFYIEATNDDIDRVFSKEIFSGTDCDWMKTNCDSVMRKLIKSIDESKILESLDVTKRSFKSWAKRAGIPNDIYSNGSLAFPRIKKECKLILSFLNDDIFEGHFTKSIFLSNSKRKPRG